VNLPHEQSPTHADSQQTLHDTLSSSPPTIKLERGTVIDRYVVLQKLGAGGMGVVYAAYDPELDRKVALKLLLSLHASTTLRARLLREAQALAKLSHPNVVTIHDVGTVDERVWLAMELVEGQTLTRWLATPRSWREVLEIMRAAGQGLAAAHAAGLLHRDFKPDNVMIGTDGRVRVMDFGLARPRTGEESSVSGERELVPASEALAMQITQAGVMVGTPSYMAPEQIGSQEVAAAADQFAFCVTLWEALYGERPFAGESLVRLVTNVMGGKRRPPVKGREVPAWLRHACERGLAGAAESRWPSMAALLDTLAQGQARARRRKLLAAVGVLALLGVAALGQRRWDLAQRTAACEASGDEIEDAWNDERERRLRDALLATGVSHAATTASRVVPALEQQARAWREARVEACLDADVRDTWDAETLDRSLWCLDERRMQLESLVDELTRADSMVVRRATTAATSLASVGMCRDAAALASLPPPPPERREAVRAVRAAVTRAGSLERAARFDAGLVLAREALARAEPLEWPSLTASARLMVGILLEDTGAYADAEVMLADAFFEAWHGKAYDVALDAAKVLVWVVGHRMGRHAEGLQWGRLAELALEEVRDDDGLQRSGLLHHLGKVHRAAGHYEEARGLHERALAIREAVLGHEHGDIGQSLGFLADISFSTGDHEQAKALFERALVIQEHALGPDHPDVAASMGNLAVLCSLTGDHARARALFERALLIQEATFGPDHPNTADIVANLALFHMTTGDDASAKLLFERALPIRERALGPRHPTVAETHNSIAFACWNLEEYEEARIHAERALALLEAAQGFAQASADHSVQLLADIALVQGRPADAVPLAERLVTALEGVEPETARLSEARLVLAKALWDAPQARGRDRERALALGTRARAGLLALGSDGATALADVDAWLAQHGED